jgi:hypothetical protein
VGTGRCEALTERLDLGPRLTAFALDVLQELEAVRDDALTGIAEVALASADLALDLRVADARLP